MHGSMPISEAERASPAALSCAHKGATKMSTKKTKREPKTKRAPSEGRKPTLAPFIDGVFDIHAEHKGKDFSAQVNADGTITYDGESCTSPSSAGKAAIKKSVDGWTFWKFKKDGTDVPLDELRGRKSPLKESAA